MLQTIREHTQGWIAGTIISIIIVTFALWGIHSYFVSNANNSVVAEVNGIDITKEQLTVAYERLRRQVQTQYGNSNTPKDDTALKDRALTSIINVEVLKQASTSQGYLITNQQIDNYLQNMPEFQVDGQFSVERFQEILSSTMLSTSEFLELIKTSLLIDQPRLGIMFTSFSLPDETSYTIALVNQEREVSYINIPAQYFLSQPIVIPAEKIKTYYEQNQNEFMTPEQVNIEYIELSLKDLLEKYNPADAELKSFYNENINSYTNPQTWKLSEILVLVLPTASQEDWITAKKTADEIVAAVNIGEDFAKYVKQYGGKSLSEKGMLTLNQVPTDLQKAVSELTKKDQVSEPIKTDHGFIILKVDDINQPKIEAFDSVKQKVKEAYVRQHAEEKFAEMRDSLADNTYEHPDSLQYAANNLGLTIRSSELFTRDKPGKDVSQFKKVRDTAFSNDVLNLQNNSDVIQLNPETVIVLRVKTHVASTLLPLKDISKQIADKLKAQEAESRAEKFTHEMQIKLQNGTDAKALASEYKFSWIEAGLIGRYSTKVDSAILDTAFRLANPSTNQGKPVYGVTRTPNGYAIVALKSVKDGTASDPKQKAVFAEQVQNSEGYLEYELFKQSQTGKAKIKMAS
ncbi:MAG: hypothetical protein ACD_46C00099G0003 [uncultured bacterium]|nr:MAG: hypothetical protein ACD_46C00099G0003 [uncultured bacterium]